MIFVAIYSRYSVSTHEIDLDSNFHATDYEINQRTLRMTIIIMYTYLSSFVAEFDFFINETIL